MGSGAAGSEGPLHPSTPKVTALARPGRHSDLVGARPRSRRRCGSVGVTMIGGRAMLLVMHRWLEAVSVIPTLNNWLRCRCVDCGRQKPRFTAYCDRCAARHDL